MNRITAGNERGQNVSRREFLAGSAMLAGTLWASSSALIALAPGPVWALELQTLDSRTARVLLSVTRQIFPHPVLDDAVYAFVVRDLDVAAAAMPAVRDLLLAGVASLDTVAGGDWFTLTDGDKLTQITALVRNPFFEKVRSTAVVSLYNNELAFAHFGYQGDSFGKGGYLERGFNDLAWLPAPPTTASPALP